MTQKKEISALGTLEKHTHTHTFLHYFIRERKRKCQLKYRKIQTPNNDINYVCIKRVVGGKVDLFINKYVSKNLRVHVFPVLHLLHSLQ